MVEHGGADILPLWRMVMYGAGLRTNGHFSFHDTWNLRYWSHAKFGGHFYWIASWATYCPFLIFSSWKALDI